MDLLLLNKQRNKISLISILSTLVFVSFYVVSIILFTPILPLTPLLGGIILLVFLYFLSSLFVMKKYLQLKVEVINKAIKNELKCNNIKSFEDKKSYLYNFYKKDSINIKNQMRLNYDDFYIEVEEFEVTSKRDFKSNKVVLAGKHLKVNLFKDYEDVVFIKNHESETEKYVDFFSYLYNKKDDNLSLDKKRYVCLYNGKVDSKVLNIFDKFNDFHMVHIKDGVADIIFIDKTPIFDFKLQKKIDQNTISYCEKCFNKTIKLIGTLRKMVRYNV